MVYILLVPTIEECEKDPYKLNQKTGCCGFAATLMHLFVTKTQALKDFLNCVTYCKPYPGVAKSTRITLRLLKRDFAGIIDINAREDWMLCHGLMILFKESSKEKADGAWQKCEDYSKLWPWTHGDLTSDTVLPTPATKVKELVESGAKVDKTFLKKLSYKRGDVAVPLDVMPLLLGLTGISVVRQGPITTEFSTFKDKKAVDISGKFSVLTQTVNRVQSAGSAASVDWGGMILGVGHEFDDKRFEAYENVTHWVYVPVKPNARPSGGSFKIWSWGKEMDFWKDLVDKKKFYPAVAIELAK